MKHSFLHNQSGYLPSDTKYITSEPILPTPITSTKDLLEMSIITFLNSLRRFHKDRCIGLGRADHRNLLAERYLASVVDIDNETAHRELPDHRE